jgi:cellulose biosynthesis protein BcsQ
LTDAAFAEYLAFVKEQKVLLIDGDPQCNSTAMMVSPEEAQRLDKNHKTLFDLIKTILQDGQQIAFERYIIQNVSNIDGENERKLDLIPSTIRFADWENMLLREMSVTYKDTNQLHRTIGRIIDKLEEYSSVTYDWVVVDAPPSFGNQARLVMTSCSVGCTRSVRDSTCRKNMSPLSLDLGVQMVSIGSVSRSNLRKVSHTRQRYLSQ